MNSLVDINCRILFVDWRARARKCIFRGGSCLLVSFAAVQFLVSHVTLGVYYTYCHPKIKQFAHYSWPSMNT